MRARDPNDILREDGVDALRAEFDSMKPFEMDDDFGLDEPASKAKRKKQNGAQAAASIDGKAPEFTDDALALSFADRHADKLRYVVRPLSCL